MKSEIFNMPKEFVNLVNQILYACDASYREGILDCDGMSLRENSGVDTVIKICYRCGAPGECKELLKLLTEYREQSGEQDS